VIPSSSPFSSGWLAFELPGYRDCDGTYCFVPYEELPLLDEALFRGEFQWLTGLDEKLKQVHKQMPEDKLGAKLSVLLNSAKEAGIQLPAPFVKFMSAPALQDQIPSCTACYFDLPDQIVKNPLEEGGHLIRFLNDQQGVLFWYLYLSPQGEHSVVVSPIPFDDPDTLKEVSREVLLANTALCAPSFEAFLYRFWIENTLWFALSDGKVLTDDQQRYVNHYN
jgi:hypothetical protein